MELRILGGGRQRGQSIDLQDSIGHDVLWQIGLIRAKLS